MSNNDRHHPLRHARNPATWMRAPVGEQLDLLAELDQYLRAEARKRIDAECSNFAPGQYWHVVISETVQLGLVQRRNHRFLLGFDHLGQPITTRERIRARLFTRETAMGHAIANGNGTVVRYTCPYYASWQELAEGRPMYPALTRLRSIPRVQP